MAISKVVVVDGNNLIVRIDRGVAGRGVTDVEPVEIDGSLYLVFTFSDGTTETVGPVGTIQYIGQAPIVVAGSTISLSTVPVNLGGTGQITANAGFNALAPTQTGNSGKYLKTDGTNSAWDLLDISTADITGTLPILNGGTGQTTANASFNALAPSQATNTGKYLKTDGTNTSWDLLDISTADITGTLAITNGGTGATTASGARTNLGLGTIATQDASAVAITGGSITGITDLAIADGGTGASNAADARSNLGLGSAAVLNAGVALGVATLDAGGTVPLSQIPASIQGGVSYQGAWNASTNTPTLVSSVGSKGYYYVVSVSGNTNLNGVTDWLVGDWAIYNGTAWEKIDNTDQVASVNGYTGVVVLSNTDVGAPPTSLTINAGTGLSGGGSLAANRTLSIANTAVSAGSYGTASAVPSFTVNGQGQLTAASDVTIAIANTQVSGLGTLSTQNANSVAITGGSITGITDLAVADGGTGASNATDARSNLSAAYNAITISAGTGLTGGGDLTANRTLAIDSSVVTLTGTQTLTNKTLTSPLVNEILDTNGNEILGLSPTASATDFVTVKNGIGTGVPLHIYADGPSTNIGLHLQPKGSGLITISDGTDFNKGIRFRSSGSAASAVTLLDAVSTAGRVVTLPDATTTLVGRDTTDTLTNKTIAFGSNTFSGSLAIANGGTGQTTANAAFNALAPSQTGNSGKYLTTDGTDTSWASNPLGTVTSVAASVPSFLSIAGSPITTSGTLAISLSGTALPTTSGGTGLTSFTANGVAYASSSSALATGSALTFDGTNLGVSGNANFGNSGSSTYGGYATGGRIFSLAASGGVIPAISASTDTTTSSTAFRAYTKEVANDTSYAYEIQTGNGTGVTTQKLQLTWGANGLWNSAALSVTGDINSTNTIRSGSGSGETLTTGSINVGKDIGLANGQGIVTGGSRLVTFASAGYVGIGNNNPLYALDVKGNSSFNVAKFTGQASSISTYIYTDTAYWWFGDGASFTGQGYTGHAINKTLSLYTDSAERVQISATGNASFFKDVTLGSYIASTNVSLNFNGVANKAKRIIFKTSGAESWLIGMGAASETDAFEIYNGNGQMALSFAKSSSTATFAGGVLEVTGSRGVRLTGGGSGEVAIAGDGSTYVLSHNFYNTTSYATQLGGMFTYVAGGALQYISMGTAYNNAGIYINGANKVGIATNEPLVNFQVNAAAGLPSSSDVSEAAILVKDSGSNRRVGIGTYASGTWIQAAYPGVAGPAYTLILNPNGGAVGIGATSPTTNLVIGNTSASGGASGGLGVFLSRGVSTNFYEAFDGTKSFIAGVDNTQGYAKVGTLSSHPVALVAGNGNGFLYLTTSGNLSLGSTSNRASAKLDILGDVMVLGSNPNYYATFTYDAGAGLLSLAAESGGAVSIKSGSTNLAKFNSGGRLSIGNTSNTYPLNITLASDSGDWFSRFENSQASAPFGLIIYYTGASPNSTSSDFFYCADSTTQRMSVKSNGGIYNFSANDSNISDRREKTNFAPAKSYLDVICAIPVQTFNYIDQNLEEDDGLTLGVIAQDVQAVAPELVSEANWGTKEAPKMRLSIYQTDLQYALMKALQELKAEFDAYKASHP